MSNAELYEKPGLKVGDLFYTKPKPKEPPEWAAYIRRRHAAEILRLRHRFIRLLMGRIRLNSNDPPACQGSVDEIRDEVKAGVNPKVLGMICRNMAGVIERVGWKNSASKACHGRPIATWRLVSWQAAEKWLNDNPIKTDIQPIKCPADTNGDGDCGRRFCPYCGDKP